MEYKLSSELIQKFAKALDDPIEKQNTEGIVSYFADDCEIELLGIKLTGREGLRKVIGWMYRYMKEIVLVPATIMIDGNAFFEEFIVKAKVKGGREIQVKQAEVLAYDEKYKVKSLRLYFDRLEIADAFSANVIDRIMIRKLIKESLKGLK